MNIESQALIKLFEEEQLFNIAASDRKEPKFNGENKKRMLVLCHSESDILPSDERELLRKILNAFKLNWEDAALMVSKRFNRFQFLKDSVSFDKLLVLGFSAAEIGMNIAVQNYQVIDFRNTKMLFSESLILLKGSEISKAQLWRSLRLMLEAI